MSDELPFHSPNYRPPDASRIRRPGEPLWPLRRGGVTWSAELHFRGESYGWEAQLLRDGELRLAHGAFVMKQDAIGWAEDQRKDIGRGILDE
jgi:hypothetical protein